MPAHALRAKPRAHPLPDALALAEKSVPRYTSYPAAPHFTAGIGPDRYADWLWRLAPCTKLSLYLHVPFCSAMCAYCGCHTKVTRRREPIDDYIEGLLAEIDLVSAKTAARRTTHLHWGGGTPSMLGPEGLERVVEALSRRFDLGAVEEHAIELDPRSVTPELARSLARVGVTRASFGVQDLDPEVQVAIGRVQPFEVVRRAIDLVREVGIDAINVDLMYGLPKQGIDQLVSTIMLADKLRPDRVALFGYAHVPWFKAHQRLVDESALPGPAERLDQAETAREMFEGLGYVSIGLDHFARPADPLAVAARAGTLGRNFQGYTSDDAPALIGLGASAIGKLPGGFAQNAPDIAGWRRAVGEGRLATVRGYALTDDDRLRADVIATLMCAFEVDLGEIARRHDTTPSVFAGDVAALDGFEGVVERHGDRIVMTPAGRPFVRLVAAAFDRHRQDAKRHSVAV